MTDDGITLDVDPDKFTIGDMEDFEEVTGVSVAKAFRGTVVHDDDGKPVRDESGRPVREMEVSAKSLKALVWILSRKSNPAFTLEDARNVKVTAIRMPDDDDGTPEDRRERGND